MSAVRLDSGDLTRHAVNVRAILAAAGLTRVAIFVSGGLDEHALERLVQDGAPIEGYGIGSSLTTSSDAPALDCAYKLQEYAGKPRRKSSEGKATWPGRKEVFRRYAEDGSMAEDVVGLEAEAVLGETLLRPAMRAGRRVADLPDLRAARSYAAAQLARLPLPLRRLEPGAVPVRISEGVRRLADSMTGASLEKETR